MKKIAQLKSLVMAMAVAGSTVAALTPATSQADVSYSAGVSNMYLWRGINISNPAPTVSGSIDWSNDMFYAGTWTSSEGSFDGSSEWDVYGGYTPKVGDFGFTLGYNGYLYPYNAKKMFTDQSTGGGMLSDYVLGMSYKDLSLTAYLNTERSSSGNNMYITADYSIGKVGLHAGINKNDSSASEYTEFNISYAATDKLTFTLSKAQGDGVKSIVKSLTTATNKSADGSEGENPQLQVSYSFM